MLVRPHNCGIDGMFLVGGRPKACQRLEYRIPHPELAPAGEAHEGRIPLAISFGQVAPRRARAQYPENAVHRSPLVRNGRTTLAPIRQQRIENVPFRVRQISPTHGCPPSRKAALNHSPMKKPSTRPSLGLAAQRRAAATIMGALATISQGNTAPCLLAVSWSGTHRSRSVSSGDAPRSRLAACPIALSRIPILPSRQTSAR